ncbi:MAG: polysaccharide deacetylase family protein [Candidatus Latescibacterota bacterium]
MICRRLLRTRSVAGQALGQLLAPLLVRAMDRAFDRAAIDWAGHPSCLALTFDCDFPEDALALPKVVELLRPHGLRASFACVGRWVEEYPAEHRAVLEAGHELMNHSWSHPELVNSPRHFVSSRADLNPRPWRDLDPDARREEIRRCQEVVATTLGYAMTGFRVPHFGKVEAADLYPELPGLRIAYSSSVLAPRAPHLGIPCWEGKVLEIPITPCPRHPYASLDSWHALYAGGGRHRANFVEQVADQLHRAIAHRGLTCIYLDPKDWERLEFGRIFASIAALGDRCWTLTMNELCRWYRDTRGGPVEAGRGA